MRYRLTFALAAALAIAGGLGPRAQQSAPQSARAAAPKLAVILVVDQMWGEYLDQFKAHWAAGLRRFVDRGAWFRNAAYPYLNTVTCVGHSTISTGAFPAAHGMILNGWWDRERAKVVACTEDPASPLVSYGAPVSGGESASRLMVPTFSDELRARGSGSRIVT